MTRPLVIDADGHVEEDLGWIVDRLPDAVKPLAPTFRREDDGTITNLIEGRPWTPDFPFPRGKETHRSAGGVRRTGSAASSNRSQRRTDMPRNPITPPLPDLLDQ